MIVYENELCSIECYDEMYVVYIGDLGIDCFDYVDGMEATQVAEDYAHDQRVWLEDTIEEIK
jgi:hypothetical protein